MSRAHVYIRYHGTGAGVAAAAVAAAASAAAAAGGDQSSEAHESRRLLD